MVSDSMLMYQMLDRSYLLAISHNIFERLTSYSCIHSNYVSYISIAAVKCQDQEQFKDEKMDFGSKVQSAVVYDGWEGVIAEGQCKMLAYHLTAAYRKQRGEQEAGVNL